MKVLMKKADSIEELAIMAAFVNGLSVGAATECEKRQGTT